MVGRPIDTEYPARAGSVSSDIVLSAKDLSGSRFQDIALDVRRGEIVGFAGSEGNGQREAIRALGGLETASGELFCNGQPVKLGAPRDALDAGLFSLSADRATESIFPGLGVRENMTVQVLQKFATDGMISAPKERASALSLVAKLDIAAADLDQPIVRPFRRQSTEDGSGSKLSL